MEINLENAHALQSPKLSVKGLSECNSNDEESAAAMCGGRFNLSPLFTTRRDRAPCNLVLPGVGIGVG